MKKSKDNIVNLKDYKNIKKQTEADREELLRLIMKAVVTK